MKRSTKTLVVLAVFCVTSLASAPLFAQEWSAAQKEVWKNVEAYWELEAQGDLEGFMGYFHSDYRGWSYQNALPGDKASARKWIGHGMKTEKTLVHEIKPVAIDDRLDLEFKPGLYRELLAFLNGQSAERLLELDMQLKNFQIFNIIHKGDSTVHTL